MRTIFILLAVLGLSNLQAEVPRLSVTASLKHVKIERRCFAITLHLVIKNISDQNTDLRVMNCSWFEHWQADKPEISIVMWDCAKNFEVIVPLKPHDTYEKDLEVCLLRPAKLPYSFKMGFMPIGSKLIYWSNDIQIATKDTAEQDAAANP